MGGFYSGAEQILGDIKKQKKSYQDTMYAANALPSSLKEGFRAKGDKGLDEAITKAEQRTMGGAIEGLDKFQDIQNPFTRRALAEKYQSSLSRTQQSLYGERDRRQGNITDYINAWAGTYGAAAKAEQVALQGMENQFSMEMQLAGKKEAAYNRSQTAGAKNTTYTDSEIIATINKLKSDGEDWEQISQMLASKGIQVGEKSLVDNELRRLHGYAPLGQEPTQKQKAEERYYGFLNAIASGDKKYSVDNKGVVWQENDERRWWKSRDSKIKIMTKP